MTRTVTIRMSDRSYELAKKFAHPRNVESFLAAFLDEYSKEWLDAVVEEQEARNLARSGPPLLFYRPGVHVKSHRRRR